MKVLLSILLCSVLLSGCNASVDSAPTTPTASLESTPTAVTEETDTPDGFSPDGHWITVYTPNEDVTGFISANLEIAELSVSEIFDALKEAGVLNEGVAANSLEVTGTQLLLDVNDAFGSQINGYGTSGEYYMLGSVVNTLLTAYQAETISITMNGQPLETGHSIYDFPLKFYPEI